MRCLRPALALSLALSLSCGKEADRGKAGSSSEQDQFIARSKAAEAKVMIMGIYRSLGHHLNDSDWTGEGHAPEARSLPPSAGPTPAKGECCKSPDRRCDPVAEIWNDPTWKSLLVEMADPHYYSYQFERAEDGKSFIISAYGDLDCDNTFSTYRVSGTYENGTLAPRSLSELDIVIDNPLE